MITGKRWEIIRILSEGDRTPTEMAKMLKISLPALHKHLVSMESEGLIRKEGIIKGKTRPYATYTLGNGFVYFAKAVKGGAEQGIIEADDDVKLRLNIWSIPQKEYHAYIEAFWWKIQEDISDIDAVAVFGSVAKGNAREGSDIDVILLAKSGAKKLEKKFSATAVGKQGKKAVVMAQVFETEDFRNSLAKCSKFAEEVMKGNKVIYDPLNVFYGLKHGRPETKAG